MAVFDCAMNAGRTDLPSGKRVSKADRVICVLGDIDELNSFLGLAKCKLSSKKTKLLLEKVQLDLMDISSVIAGRARDGFDIRKALSWIDDTVNKYTACGNRIRTFCVPGRDELDALLNVARAVARRAERGAVKLFTETKRKEREIPACLNQISNLLFALICARKK